MKRQLLFLSIGFLFILGGTSTVKSQHTGIKTNTLYLATTTPNLGLEFLLGRKTTFSLSAGYNPFTFRAQEREDGVTVRPRLRHWSVTPEFKYWFCRSYERHFLGLHGLYGEYNLGGISFVSGLRDYRYQGNAYGGGISWGYQWATGGRWGLELSLGAGYLHLRYAKYDCGDCGELQGEYKRNYIGPTKASLSMIYFLN